MECFDAFTSDLRQHFSQWVNESLICELEDYWDNNNIDKAYSVGAVMCHRIPDRAKTEQFKAGIDLLCRTKSRLNQPEISGRMQFILRTKEHVVRKETPERDKRPKQHDEPTAVGYYFNVLISGMKDENLPYIHSVLGMDTSVPYHRELKDIALFTKNLFTRIYWFENKLKDVRIYVKNTANDTHHICEGYEPVFKEPDIVSRISQLLSDVELDIDVIVTKWYMCRGNAMSCLKWIARVAKEMKKESGYIPHIADDVSLNKDEQNLYKATFDLLSDLSTGFRYRNSEGENLRLRHENTTLKNDIDEMKRQIKDDVRYCYDLQGENSSLRHENSKLKRNVDEMESLIEKKKQCLNSMTSKIESLEINKTQILQMACALNSKNDDLDQENAKLVQRLQSCEEQLEAAEASAIYNENRSKEKEQVQNMIKDLQERINSLKGQNEVKDTQLKKAAKKLLESERKYEDLLSKNIQSEEHFEYLTNELKKVEMERDSVTIRKEELVEEMTQLKHDVIRWKNESNRSNIEGEIGRIKKLETENKNLSDAKEHGKQETILLQKDLHRIRGERQELKQKNQTLEVEVAKLKQDKNGQWELTVMQRQKRDSEKIRQLEQMIDKLKADKEGLVDRLRVNECDTKTTQELKIKVVLAEEEIGQLKHVNGDLILEIERLKQELQTEKKGREDDKTRRHESDKQQLEYLRDGMKQLQNEKEEMTNRYENERRHTREVEDKLKRLERERGVMTESVLSRKQHERKNEKDLEDQVRQLKSEKQELIQRQESDKQILETKIKQMETEKEDLEHRLIDPQQYAKTIGKLEAQLALAENEKSQLQNRASSRQHHDKTNMEGLEDKIRQLEMEKQEMTKRLTETQQYTRKIEQLEAQLVTIGNENTRLRNKLIESQENEKTIEQLETKLTAVENEKRQMQDGFLSRQHHDRNKAKELEDKVKRLAREKQEIMVKRSEETQQQSKAIEQLEAKLASAENEKWQLQSGQKYERNKTKELEDRVRQLETEKKEIVKSRGESERRLAESEQMLQGALSEQDNLQKQLETEEIKRQQLQQFSASRANEDSIHKLKKQLDAREREVHNLKQEVKKIKDEKDDLQNRFSKVAAAQLTHENPNIADLSDKHRPTKLGEIYSELYDNEWTEAFSQIEDSSSTASEEGIVKRLMDILVSSYNHCESVSDSQMNGLKTLLFSPNAESHKRSVRQDLSAEQSRAVVDLRKQTSNAAIETIKKDITSKYSDSRRYPALKAYIEKCAELCWLMVVQSPAVYIDDKDKPGDHFDKDVFKAYTRSGPIIDFVVWPPIYLHRGGPLLCKGTAQGKS